MKCINLDDFKNHCPTVDCSDKCSDVPFRKVNIPAAMGDDIDGEYAPENGLYKNALVEYEANGALYIYSSDGVFTRLGYNTQGSGDVTKDYVDIQDGKTLSSANSYADTAISSQYPTINQLISAGDATTLQSAKTYADAQDSATLQAAKDYTDTHSGQGGVTQEYVDTQDAATLVSAQSYADEKASISLTSAKEYTDTRADETLDMAGTNAQAITNSAIANANIPVITVQTTDPGEGADLSDNHFIAVYLEETS